jgi:ribosome biogenesis protein BMS1
MVVRQLILPCFKVTYFYLEPKGEGEEMVIRLQDVNSTLDDAVARSNIQLLRSSRNALLPGRPEEDEGSSESDNDMLDDSDEDDGDPTSDEDDLEGPTTDAYHTEEDDVDVDEIASRNTGRTQARSNRRAIGSLDAVANAGTEEFTEGSDDGELWEGELIGEQQHTRSFPALERRTSLRKDWMKAIYQLDTVPDGPGAVTASDPDDDLFQLKHPASNDDEFSDRTKEHPSQKDIHTDLDLDHYRAYFFLSREETTAAGDDETAEQDSEKDFEDLESADQHPKEVSKKPTDDRASLAAKKELLKQKFDEQYDDPETSGVDFYTEKKNEISKQLELNRAAFEGMDDESRALVEGHLPGAYIRVELANAPCELIEHFKPEYPLLLGGLLPAEERLGFVQVRIKRHRWFAKPLKTNDPLIISLGWRRFQTLPVYSLDDHSIRMRMLKYTPEHMHCYATFYGPAEVPNTGFCAFNTLSSAVAGFRISATGVVLDVDCSTKIVKKLKLTGVPFEIHKNTAFIKEMFNSALEVAKFEGANIRTVSGLRGQIKKAVSKPEGAFRATFEDKILMSGTYEIAESTSDMLILLKPSFRHYFLESVVCDSTTKILQPRYLSVVARKGGMGRHASNRTNQA